MSFFKELYQATVTEIDANLLNNENMAPEDQSHWTDTEDKEAEKNNKAWWQ